MGTARKVIKVGGNRTLVTPERERMPAVTDVDTSKQATAPSVEPAPTGGRWPALIPATMNIAQAAAYIGIAKSTLYTWRTRRPGFGPRAVKAGGALRYRRSDLDAWIELTPRRSTSNRQRTSFATLSPASRPCHAH